MLSSESCDATFSLPCPNRGQFQPLQAGRQSKNFSTLQSKNSGGSVQSSLAPGSGTSRVLFAAPLTSGACLGVPAPAQSRPEDLGGRLGCSRGPGCSQVSRLTTSEVRAGPDSKLGKVDSGGSGCVLRPALNLHTSDSRLTMTGAWGWGRDGSSDPDKFQAREGSPGEPGSGGGTGRGRDTPELPGTRPWSAQEAATHGVRAGGLQAVPAQQACPHGLHPAETPGEGALRPRGQETGAPASRHSLGDHGDLDPEDARLFSGRHPLQAELPAGELD